MLFSRSASSSHLMTICLKALETFTIPYRSKGTPPHTPFVINCGDVLPTPQPPSAVHTGLGIRSLVFRANRSFFCELKSERAIRSFPRANHSRRYFVKKKKSDRSNLLLGIQIGKAVKNCQKQDENNAFF